MAAVLRPKLSGQLYAFYTGTIYDTFIFQLCTQRFSTAVLVDDLSPYFLAFIVLAYAKSLPEEGQLHFICILEFCSLHKTRTRCIQNTSYTGWYSTLLVPGILSFPVLRLVYFICRST